MADKKVGGSNLITPEAFRKQKGAAGGQGGLDQIMGMLRSHDMGLKMIAKKLQEIEEASFTSARYYDLICLSLKDVAMDKLQISDEEWDGIVARNAQKIHEAQEEEYDKRNKLKTVDRPVQKDDWVAISFVGKVDGEVFEGGSSDGTLVVVGKGQFLSELEGSLLDKKVGDAYDADVTFPEKYQAKHLEGKTATFSIKVLSVKEQQKVEEPKVEEPTENK